MRIVRTIGWVLLLVALVLFSVANWNPPVSVMIWENLVVDTRIPAIVVIAFLLGLVPMWLVHRARRWHLERRIASLESAVRAAAVTAPQQPATSDPATQPSESAAPEGVAPGPQSRARLMGSAGARPRPDLQRPEPQRLASPAKERTGERTGDRRARPDPSPRNGPSGPESS